MKRRYTASIFFALLLLPLAVSAQNKTESVTVTGQAPQTRTETAQENAQGPALKDPNGGAYGPDTCRQGFVWRDAFPGDNVCVIPASRDRAAADNAAAASRTVLG